MGDYLYWNDSYYISCSGQYSEGKTLSMTNDGWEINEVKEDETHTFVVIRSFLDQYLMVKENYEVPTSGNISIVAWNQHQISDIALCNAISEILEQISIGAYEKIEDVSHLQDDYLRHPIYIAFEDCPVATNFMGYLWPIDGDWYFITKDSANSTGTEHDNQIPKLSGYLIPIKYGNFLETYK